MIFQWSRFYLKAKELSVVVFAVAIWTIGNVALSRADDAAPSLGLPIECRLAENCWVVNLVDLDQGPRVLDYKCNSHSYNGHKGTDFAIRDARTMRGGVPVVASAAGTVKVVRDGMRDVDVSIIGGHSVKNVECGNGVVFDHGRGWETQYCHLRKGSVSVKAGQAVKQGARLGSVGMSGMAEFPHVHLSVRHRGRIVDPFLGPSPVDGNTKCGSPKRPMWKAGLPESLYGSESALYAIGFAAKPPAARAARAGRHADRALPRNAPVLVLWVDAFWVYQGDRLTLTITGPDGERFHRYSNEIKRNRARQFLFSGRKKKALFWPAGEYEGEAVLIRKQANGKTRRFVARQTVTLK